MGGDWASGSWAGRLTCVSVSDCMDARPDIHPPNAKPFGVPTPRVVCERTEKLTALRFVRPVLAAPLEPGCCVARGPWDLRDGQLVGIEGGMPVVEGRLGSRVGWMTDVVGRTAVEEPESRLSAVIHRSVQRPSSRSRNASSARALRCPARTSVCGVVDSMVRAWALRFGHLPLSGRFWARRGRGCGGGRPRRR
jgi:hypothetical protein